MDLTKAQILQQWIVEVETTASRCVLANAARIHRYSTEHNLVLDQERLDRAVQWNLSAQLECELQMLEEGSSLSSEPEEIRQFAAQHQLALDEARMAAIEAKRNAP